MNDHLVLLSIPALRAEDLQRMPNLAGLMAAGDRASLVPSFPCVTWPVQASMLSGKTPSQHGVVANGFYWRDEQRVEMWTAWNDTVTAPQIWDVLHEQNRNVSSAVWFPMLSKGCGADYVCMPAPVRNPDGSESLWCYTKPTELYGELRDQLGHFPLQHFWGPLAGVQATAWIADSAIFAAKRYLPDFFFIYLPHLDYAAQRSGPDSDPALRALDELDVVIGKLAEGILGAMRGRNVIFLAASEYVISPVDHVAFPNRALRRAGLLQVRNEDDGEHLDLQNSQAWALVDHQFAHVFVRGANPGVISQVVELFRDGQGIAEVLAGTDRDKYHMTHDRSGEVILISKPDSWQAYYWWLDGAHAPGFARTVDIHRKPGYDPVELHFDRATKSIPLDATLIRGSHGAPATSQSQRGVLLSSRRGVLDERDTADTEVANIVLRRFGVPE